MGPWLGGMSIMSADAAISPERVEHLLARLGYVSNAGWVPAGAFDDLATHRFAMQQAKREMSVIGAFCLKREGKGGHLVVTPIVYVAAAEDDVAAKEIHRKVWSQGLVPFLLALTPERLALCPGFSFAQERWDSLVRWFPWSAVDGLPTDPTAPGEFVLPLGELWDLRAIRLRTSLFWRDHSIDVQGRVDQRLLGSLNALSDVLIRGVGVSRSLSPSAANGLIGRFLYIYFLYDRGIVDQEWVTARGHGEINLAEQYIEWPAVATWEFFDDLDSIFNGSIFPLSAGERAEIDNSHVNLVRRVMKHGAYPVGSGALQLSFLDFYLGALRTETLSAVYEQFLENIKAGERRRVGAFYTPPFLVDFMLDRIEEALPFADGMTVLDPSAGSGVFLVGAYRRLIERTRAGHAEKGMDLDQLRELLVRNVFGIERNSDACHVAAFSLYLTMLDYIDPRDLTRIAKGDAPEKLFPGLVGSNLFPEDFFADRASFPGLPDRVRCVIGTPPWQTIEKLDSPAAEEWRDQHKRNAPVGKNQTAELFTWKVMHEHLCEGGVLGFLLPAKSLINPTSWHFRRELARQFTLFGAANFAHLRYRLFASARQAVVAMFAENRAPTMRDKTWVYSPLSIGQPMADKERPWTILLDRADVQVFRHVHVTLDPWGWFEAFMLRPVDRQIRRYLDDAATERRISLLETLCDSVGAAIRRGGNAAETGIERAFLIDAPSDPLPAIELLREHASGLFGPGDSPHDVILPPKQLANLTRPYRERFGGSVLLVPRNFRNIRFVEHPIGYTSSSLGVFFQKPAETVSGREKQLLRAIGRYLGSRVALYLVATTGRRWLMDRRNIEPTDLARFPVPISGLDDPRLDGLLNNEGAALERFILKALGLEGDFERAVEEFLVFRIGFQDGDVPEKALGRPNVDTIGEYTEVLGRTLDGLIGRKGAFAVAARSDPGAGVGAVAAHYWEGSATETPSIDLGKQCQLALDRYVRSSANSFSDSLGAAYDEQTSSVTFVKPLEYFRWTVDSAFADSRKMMDVFVAGRA